MASPTNEFEQVPGVDERQGSLACYSPWGCKDSDMTERLNNCKSFFSSSLLSAIRVISSAYQRMLVFLPLILILICNSSSPTFLMMCSAYRLNKQGDPRQPCYTPFSILSQSVVLYRVLTLASWPAYKFLRRQVRRSGIPISLELSTVCYDPHNQRL